MLKLTVQGEGVEIWFTPSFNIKTTSKELEFAVRSWEVDAFDPKQTAIRKVKAQQGEWEAYLLFTEIAIRIPELNIKFKKVPETPTFPAGETRKELLN